jgi:GTP-binding protein
MQIKTAQFVTSNTDYTKCPPAIIPEYAFIGRSNVGKSSLINMLCGQKSLAKTSGKPGKTQLINHFIINNAWYLVDLPGYGYAQVSKTKKEQWEKFIESYILERKNLLCLVVLIDARLPLQKVDDAFMEWLGNNQIPFVIAFTKIDKLTKNQLAVNLAAYMIQLSQKWEELPRCFYTSAETRQGKEELLDFINEANTMFIYPN